MMASELIVAAAQNWSSAVKALQGQFCLRLLATVVAATLCSSGFAQPAGKAPSSEVVTVDPYDDLIASMQPPELVEASISKTVGATMAAMLSQDKEFAQLEAESPGLMKAITEASMPVIRRKAAESTTGMAADLRRLFTERLSPQDAKEMAEFWRSDAGYALLTGVVHNLSGEETIAAVLAEKDIQADTITRDATKAAVAATKGLRNDQRLVATLAMSSSAGLKFGVLQPEVMAIKAKWENLEWTAADDAEIEEVVVAAVEKFFAAD